MSDNGWSEADYYSKDGLGGMQADRSDEDKYTVQD
jgi:hypothetical protein